MKCRDIVRFAAPIINFFSVFGAGVAAYYSYSAADSANKLAISSALRQQMIVYIDNYLKGLEYNKGIVLDSGGYKNASTDGDVTGDQVRWRATAGLLVGVVELMKVNGDIRYERWRGFIEEMSGPLCDRRGFLLEDYASDADIKRYIVDIKKKKCK